jgi:hypothetical protein
VAVRGTSVVIPTIEDPDMDPQWDKRGRMFRWKATAVFLFIFCLYSVNSVRFEALTAVLMKSRVFWGFTKCYLLKRCRRFGGSAMHPS